MQADSKPREAGLKQQVPTSKASTASWPPCSDTATARPLPCSRSMTKYRSRLNSVTFTGAAPSANPLLGCAAVVLPPALPLPPPPLPLLLLLLPFVVVALTSTPGGSEGSASDWGPEAPSAPPVAAEGRGTARCAAGLAAVAPLLLLSPGWLLLACWRLPADTSAAAASPATGSRVGAAAAVTAGSVAEAVLRPLPRRSSPGSAEAPSVADEPASPASRAAASAARIACCMIPEQLLPSHTDALAIEVGYENRTAYTYEALLSGLQG